MTGKRVDINRRPGDFWEHTREAWADIDGSHWQARRAAEETEPAIPIEQLHGWLAEGARLLTDRQRAYIDAYYNRGLSTEYIAQAYGVNKSTVSRLMSRGIRKMQQWVDAKKMITLHTNQQGRRNVEQILDQLPPSLLSQRQRQFLLIKLSNPALSNLEIADMFGFNKSTVTITLRRARRNLQALGISDIYPNKIKEV